MNTLILFLIIIPIVCAAIVFLIPEKYKRYKDIFFIAVAVFNLWAVCFYFTKNIFIFCAGAAFDFSFSVIMSRFSELLLVISAVFVLLASIFAVNNMKNNPKSPLLNAGMLLAVSFVNGAVITDSLIFLLIFMEAMAIPFVMMILSSENDNKKLAVKAFTITAIADLFLMMGIGFIYSLAKTMNMSEVSLNLTGLLPITAFVCVIIGAAGKLGVMPFHSWLPEASEKTPVSFMVFMATAAEKILGIYILYVALKMFGVENGNCVTYILMGFAAVSAFVSALMSNSQKSFKKMLAYTSISQGSFMMIAMLTALPIAVAGAVLHLLAHTIYKSCLFFIAGIIDDSKTETVSYKKNPYIFLCFILAIASFIGIPFFAAFYSKEMIYEGALHLGVVWHIIMVLVTFFCSSAALKWLGKIFFNNDDEFFEYPLTSMIPVLTTAFLCLLCGIFRNIPEAIIQTVIPFPSEENANLILIIVSSSALGIVFINFIIGHKKYKNGLGFVKPIISSLGIDKLNENENADPYNMAMSIYDYFAEASFSFDKALNWVYDIAFVKPVLFCSQQLDKVHNGSLSRYILWALCGLALIILFFV
ncbi:MAG: complex I subunit 5 family protein [Endomicrobium sp.]|jgi:formate hydrogenlyase subunit 3/multisubunit Na+/H+ antiporter MnhD subunit|nr:complex I subunit 5 family protein [Endomicrobium sp.]